MIGANQLVSVLRACSVQVAANQESEDRLAKASACLAVGA